ncbi:hypothetical protein PENTCL1PPCAC_22696, partial [Pristionchus entomophagus]
KKKEEKKEKDKHKRDRRDDEEKEKESRRGEKVGMEDISPSTQSFPPPLANCAMEEKPIISLAISNKSRDEEAKKNLVKPLPADLEARPMERKEDALMSKYAVKETNTKEMKKKNKKEVRQVVLPGLTVRGQRGKTDDVDGDGWSVNETVPSIEETEANHINGVEQENNHTGYEDSSYGFAMPQEVHNYTIPFARDLIGGMGGIPPMGGMVPHMMETNNAYNPLHHPLPIGHAGIFRPTIIKESSPMGQSSQQHEYYGRNELSGFTESPVVEEPPLIENPFDYPGLEKDSVRHRNELINFLETHIPVLEENAALFDSPQIDLDQLKNMLENFIEFQFFGNEEEKRTMISTLSNLFAGKVETDIIPFLSDLPCFKYGYVDGRLIVSVKMEGKERREREANRRREREEEEKRLEEERARGKEEVRKALAELERRRQKEEEDRILIEKEEEERKRRKEEEEKRRIEQKIRDEEDRKIREKRRKEEEDRRQKELRRREDEEKERNEMEEKKKREDTEKKIRDENERKELVERIRREANEEKERMEIENENEEKIMIDNQKRILEEKRKNEEEERERRMNEMIEEERRGQVEVMSIKKETGKRTKEKELERKTRDAINTLREHKQSKSCSSDSSPERKELLKCTRSSSSSLSRLPPVTSSSTSFSTSAPPFIPRSTNPKAELNPNAPVFIPSQSPMEELLDENGDAVDSIWMDVNRKILDDNRSTIDELNCRIIELEEENKAKDEINIMKEMEISKKEEMRIKEEQKNRETIGRLESRVNNMSEQILWKGQEISKMAEELKKRSRELSQMGEDFNSKLEDMKSRIREEKVNVNIERREKENVMGTMERSEEEKRRRLLERKTEVARTAVLYCTDIINRLASDPEAQVMTSLFIDLRTKWMDHHSILNLQIEDLNKGRAIDWEFALSMREPKMPRDANQLVQECYVWHYQTMHILSFRLASIVKKCLREHNRYYEDVYIIGIIQKWMRIHKDPTKIEATVPQVANMVAQAMDDAPLMPPKYVYVTAPSISCSSTPPTPTTLIPPSLPSRPSSRSTTQLRTQSSSSKNEPKGWKKASAKVRQVELENHECSICLENTEGGDISYCEQVSCNEPYHNDCLDDYWARRWSILPPVSYPHASQRCISCTGM